MTLKTGPTHKDVRASTRYKGSWAEEKVPKHHTISWYAPDANILVKVFDKDTIELSMNGTAHLSLDDLATIRDECVRYLGQA